ncbi:MULTISPECIES: hypothetical protein [unclassified Shewanella]|uniref:hypothetical protein n=1 Tax=unclassified Shewanella TaxID=196818 RepID=UPI001BC41D2B|nr:MULTISPECIES: hypothetical protein [unclassified Shewanella]GIU07242.1 hypothetical protein TUM4444_06440 [Shewanella sp. MBTL60-112-B1]GIU35630.1 hypothetical protein TUM4445_25680 [Shewanella sp. MBTL60-112-B2]
MNKGLNSGPFSGFKATPILATLTFIFGLCLLLDHSTAPDEASMLSCTSGSYRVGTGFESTQRLEMANTLNGVNLSLSFFKGDKLAHKIMAKGTVTKVKAPILTYEVELNQGQYLRGLLQTDYSESLQMAITAAQKQLSDEPSKPFLIKVLEMNKAAGVVTIQISPGNHLWACKLSH